MVVALDDGAEVVVDNDLVEVVELLPVARVDVVRILAEALRTSDGEAAKGDAKCDVTTRSKGHRHTSSIHAMVSEGARMSANAARIGARTTLSVIAS